jgi:ribosome-associated toxin RatA of RatAB toxin-antitoxin module
MVRLGVAIVLATGLWVTAAQAQPIEVAVRMQAGTVVVDVTAKVAVRHEVAWAVLTDYEHMAEFLTALKASTVLARSGNSLEVAQTGQAKFGFLHFEFSTVRAVELDPEQEIRSRMIRGDFKSYEFSTRVTDDLPGTVKIVHHGEYMPNRWVPPVVGPAMIQSETHKQYTEFIAEMLKRQGER